MAGCRLRDLGSRERTIALVLGVLVGAPFVIAAIQAAVAGWYPVADEGTMLTIARQVFSDRPPLTGEVTSLDRYGIRAYHPGPLVFYVFAPFVALVGGSLGLLLGAAFVSAGAIVLIGYVALRTAGSGAALWAWATAMLMVWSLGGTAYLYRPFKTVSALLLVILLFLHLSAALAVGRPGLLPLWVLAASYPVAASMRNEGVNIGVEGGAPGLGDPEDGSLGTSAGTIIVLPSFLPRPSGWDAVATYEPDDRSSADADQVADELVGFARETEPVPLDTLAFSLPTLLCPELVVVPPDAAPGTCPVAEGILAEDNPVAGLPPAWSRSPTSPSSARPPRCRSSTVPVRLSISSMRRAATGTTWR